MRWLDRIEDRLHWLAFPGLYKYLALTGVVVNAWGWLNPSGPSMLDFSLIGILNGEVWRIFSFALTPNGLFPLGALGVLFLYFATRITFLISDSLEEIWGPTRTTLYILLAWAGLVVGQALMILPVPMSGIMIGLSLFLAFATLFPKYEFHLFLVLPVQVRWLGWAAFAMAIYGVIRVPLTILLVLPALVPYGLWVLPDFIRNRKGLAQAAVRRRKFEAAALSDGHTFNRCSVCKRTEKDDEDLEFRTYADGTEYCLDHLPDDDSET